MEKSKLAKWVGLLGFLVGILFFFRYLYVNGMAATGDDKTIEMAQAILIGSIAVLPGLFFQNRQTPEWLWVRVVYVFMMLFAVLGDIYIADPLGYGLPMMLIVIPFCLVVASVILIKTLNAKR